MSTAAFSAAAAVRFALLRLEQVEPVVLDRELDVLHVSVVLLEPAHRVDQLLERVGKRLLHLRERLRRADAGDDVLALRIGEELAVEPGLAGRRVAREGDARARALALVPEDHLDDVDRGAEVVGDVVGPAVDLGARVVPRLEDGAHGARELVPRVLRERAAGLLPVDPLEGLDQLGQVLGVEVDVLRCAALRLQLRQRVLEEVRRRCSSTTSAVHLDQAAVRVVGEARVAGALGEPADGVVVQAEVEDRVHHPGHRDRGAGADGDEQRVSGSPNRLPVFSSSAARCSSISSSRPSGSPPPLAM